MPPRTRLRTQTQNNQMLAQIARNERTTQAITRVINRNSNEIEQLNIQIVNGIPQFAFADNETMFQRWIDRRNTLLNEIRHLVVSLAFHG